MKLSTVLLRISVLSLALLLAGCSLSKGFDLPELRTVASLDLNRYSGLWYEVASKPNIFQSGCRATTAEYQLKEDGQIKILNRCKRGDGDEISVAEGLAWMPDANSPGKLKVQFFWPFKGDYWVLNLDPDYRRVLVGTPNRKYFWIMSREKVLDESELVSLLDLAGSYGYDIKQAQRTTH